MNTQANILIVDDDEGTCRTLALILQKKGYHTKTAATGREGLEKSQGSFFNVAILDIKLPDMEGTALIAPLKETHPDILVIMITAYASVETAVKALNKGALAYLTKPVNIDETLAVVGEALDKQRLVAAKREAEERFRDVALIMADWIWETDKNCIYTYCSERVEETLGYSGEELIGKTPFDLMPPDEAKRVGEIFAGIAAKKEPIRDLENWNTHKDGRLVCFLTNGVPLLDRQGNLKGYRGVDKDITERKRAEVTLSQKAEELARSNAELDRFAHSVSHDLKSPLVTLQGFASHVAQDAEQGRVDRLPGFAGRIIEATGRMEQLIDGLLNLSRIAQVVNPSEHIAMTELIHDIARAHESALSESHVALEVQDDMPTINADRTRVIQVFDNLLANSLKHGLDTHEPRVSIGARDEGSELRFFVRDNGPGIPAEYHGKVFDLFTRLQTNSQGTGVGLAIVKQGVVTLGGRVWLESEPGQGATFWVAFPKESIGIRDPVYS